jgi:pimeloyl-ACP methyl ester carboxylesterase
MSRFPLRPALLAGFCAVPLLMAGCTLKVEESALLHPDHDDASTAVALSQRVEAIAIEEADGAVSRGLRITRPDAVATVLYFGSNDYRIDVDGQKYVHYFSPLPVNVILFDYRGYGRSDGKTSVASVMADCEHIYDRVRAETKGSLIVHGLSMGAFVTAHLSAVRPLDGAVIEGTGAAFQTMVDRQIPWYAAPFITLDVSPDLLKIDPGADLRRGAAPILMMTGDQDDEAPKEYAQSIYATLRPDRARLLIVPGAVHRDSMAHAEAITAYRQFLSRVTGKA